MTKKSIDNEAFLKVLEANKGIIYKVSRAYCPDAHEREDLVQEIMIQIWRSFHRYDSKYKISTWIYRIALNVAISWYRKVKRSVVYYPENEPAVSSDNQADDREEEVSQLYRFINELKELDKALILLYLEEKSHDEIAEILGISKSNVATKVQRIKQKLRERFETIKNETL